MRTTTRKPRMNNDNQIHNIISQIDAAKTNEVITLNNLNSVDSKNTRN